MKQVSVNATKNITDLFSHRLYTNLGGKKPKLVILLSNQIDPENLP